jgi:hypothetical protein
VISAGERWVTVSSGSGWFLRGGEGASPDFALELVYHPARYFAVTTYELWFNASLKVDYRGWRVTSDGDLILVREPDERLGVG